MQHRVSHPLSQHLAAVISAVSSPLLIVPAFGLWVIADVSATRRQGLEWMLLFLLLTLLPTALHLVHGVWRGHLTDLHLSVREQRGTSFAISTIGAALLFGSYFLLHAPAQLTALAACLAVSGLIFYVITQYWKISIHSAGYTGSVFIVSLLLDPKWFWLLLALPFIFWARWARNRHTVWQVIVASLVVAVCVTVTLELALG